MHPLLIEVLSKKGSMNFLSPDIVLRVYCNSHPYAYLHACSQFRQHINHCSRQFRSSTQKHLVDITIYQFGRRTAFPNSFVCPCSFFRSCQGEFLGSIDSCWTCNSNVVSHALIIFGVVQITGFRHWQQLTAHSTTHAEQVDSLESCCWHEPLYTPPSSPDAS